MGIPKLLWFPVVIATCLALTIGCSGGSTDPITPPGENLDPAITHLEESMTSDGRVLWGMWTLGIDPVKETIDVSVNRDSSAHWDVKSFLIPPACADCISAKFNGQVTENTYEILVTLKNPTGLTGYDVRGTVLNKGVLELRNPDSYTFILVPPSETSPRPFVAYDTGFGRPFPGFTTHTEAFHIFNLYHPNYATVDFVVDASWPGNCREPYAVANCQATGVFMDDGSNTAKIYCDIFDWQDDVHSVTVDLTALGGDSHAQMTHTTGVTWVLSDVSWQPGGYLPATYKGLVTAVTEGTQAKRETYNYVLLTISNAGGGGGFVAELPNWSLTGDHAPGPCLDLAVVGDDAGASYTMVVGNDWGYHLWDSFYDPSTSSGYVTLTDPHEPIVRFDTASLATPELVDTWAWAVANDDPDPLNPTGQPPQNAPISYWTWIWWWWDHNPDIPGNDPDIDGWILYEDPDGVPPIATYTEAFDACGGFARDGLQYWGNIYAAGDETLYPYVAVHGFNFPYDQPDSYGYGGYVIEGAGVGKVNWHAVNGLDVDDMDGLDNTFCVFSEGSPENVIEVFSFDYPQAIIDSEFEMTHHLIIDPMGEPIDVELFPAKNLGKDSNWICVLTSSEVVEVYKITDGSLVTIFGGAPLVGNEARFLDIDDLNYKVHIMQDGPQVSVFYYDPG